MSVQSDSLKNASKPKKELKDSYCGVLVSGSFRLELENHANRQNCSLGRAMRDLLELGLLFDQVRRSRAGALLGGSDNGE